MTAPISIQNRETGDPRERYEAHIRDALRAFWKRKSLIASIVATVLLLAVAGLVLIGPRYTSEAMIRLNFAGDQLADGSKGQPIAALEAGSLVESAARIVRSRATASSAVAHRGLDKDPLFTTLSIASRSISALQLALGLGSVASEHDLAVSELMRRVKVTTEPRSYLITIAATASSAELAARLANMVALEYLRGQMLQQLMEANAAVDREMAETASIFGVRHPKYILIRSKLDHLKDRIRMLRDDATGENAVKLAAGQSLLPAEQAPSSSGPNLFAILGIVVAISLVLSGWLALVLERGFSNGATARDPSALSPSPRPV